MTVDSKLPTLKDERFNVVVGKFRKRERETQQCNAMHYTNSFVVLLQISLSVGRQVLNYFDSDATMLLLY